MVMDAVGTEWAEADRAATRLGFDVLFIGADGEDGVQAGGDPGQRDVGGVLAKRGGERIAPGAVPGAAQGDWP
jgi:hypothetical protein